MSPATIALGLPRRTRVTAAAPRNRLGPVHRRIRRPVLHVVSELGVVDEIGDEPVSSNALAASCHVDPSALDRVLRSRLPRLRGAGRATPRAAHEVGADPPCGAVPAIRATISLRSVSDG